MSNELSLSVSLLFSKGGQKISRSISKTVNVSGNFGAQVVQNIGTTEEEVVIPGSIAVYGYTLLINLDSTNYIEVGAITGQYSIKLKAGEFALARCKYGDTLYAKANTAACDLEVVMISE